MSKCNRCGMTIDRDKDAFVTIPNAEQCGYKARRPTSFAHACCFERDLRADVARELKERDSLMLEIGRANRQMSIDFLAEPVVDFLDEVEKQRNPPSMCECGHGLMLHAKKDIGSGLWTHQKGPCWLTSSGVRCPCTNVNAVL